MKIKEFLRLFNKESFFRKYIVNYTLAFIGLYMSISGAWNMVIEGEYLTVSDIAPYFTKIEPNDFTAQVSRSFESREKCVFNDSEWAIGFGDLQKKEDGLYLLTPDTSNSLLQYERSISSGADITFSFVPLSESSVNVVIIAHELFEIVVGDAGKRRITVKANLIEGSPMSLISADNEDSNSFLLPEELIVGKEVSIKITQQPLSINQHELILNITYDSSQDPVIKSYHFIIPPEFKASNKPIRVSIGMINTDNKDDILTRFKCFKTSLNSLDSNVTYLDF